MKKKVIISDEMRTLVERDASFFSRSGFEFISVTFTDDILKTLRKTKADLIIAEHSMPGTCIDEIFAAIRKDPSLRKVSIIVACPDTPTAKERCRASGANDFVTKPVTVSDLADKAKKFLEISARGSYRVLMSISVKGQFRDFSFFATTRDISETGVLIETEKVLAAGDRMSCSFFLASQQITVDGEVMRVVQKGQGLYQYGIRFVDIQKVVQMKISDLVRARSKA